MNLEKPVRYPTTLLVVLGTAVLLARAPADDWPQWQGPDRNAISKETGLLKEWPKEGPSLAWKANGLGGGYSGPSVAAGRIFGMSNRGEDEVVWALSESDGKELWVTRLGPAFKQSWPQGKEGPGCTPTVDGDRLYVLGLGGELACLQVKDGKILWQRNLTRDFGGRVPMWSYRESPLIDGDKLICTPGGEEATILALNKLTGDPIWKCQVQEGSGSGGGGPAGPGGRRGGFGGGPPSGAGYASAIAIDFEGQRQYVQLTAKALVGVSASDGKLLWRYARPANGMGINCSTPIYIDGHVFAASAYGAGGGLARLIKDASGEIKAEEVWFSRKMQNHHGGMIVFDGCLYGANGGNEGGALVCLDFKTGDVLWDMRDDAERRAPKGSLVMADNRLYYRTEKGTMLLIEPNRKEYIERGRFEQPDRTQQPAWTHPVIANGKLYLRDQDLLFCYDIRAK
ncbi:MAG: PQQ-binding-like beta-propeller repeat protein [Verrucomicrobia bacterium]|nr:PQQ-binding-like beta-propeller repeat protein [Verrucomicrobiota bacterium]